MIWYSAGTVSVTTGATTVTGSGTAWVANVRPGDAIHLPDGRAYEVTAVNSDTSLTISPGYLGSTASGQDYRVQPTRGVVATLVASVQALIAQVQGYVDGALSGRFGNGSAGAPSVSFASDTDTGVWRIGANVLGVATGGAERLRVTNAGAQLTGLLTGTAITSSATDTTVGRVPVNRSSGFLGWAATGSPPAITTEALNDLPTGLYRSDDMSAINGGNSPLGGGFGWALVLRSLAGGAAMQMLSRNNAADGGLWWRIGTDAWRNLYDRLNILGTVSQEAGVPTGAVIERGSNANGQFVRFADGTQLCWRTLTLPRVAVDAIEAEWTLPAAFASNEVSVSLTRPHAVSLHDDVDRANLGASLARVGSNGTVATLRVQTLPGAPALASGAQVRECSAVAVGRWF